jgi:hypothetical protein
VNVATAPKVFIDTTEGLVAPLVYELINGEPGDFGPSLSIAFLSNSGQFEAGVVFHDYIPKYRRAEISIASVKKNWLTRARLIDIMLMPTTINCDVIIAKTDPSNRNAIALMEGCGAKSTLIPNGRGFGKDEVHQVMLMSDLAQSKFWRNGNGR